MRFLIFGDIHGNLPALEKLFEIEKGEYDCAICHGDVVNYGPWSNACVEFLERKDNIIKLFGNHEHNYLEKKYTGTNPIAQAFFNYCFPKFSKSHEIKKYRESFQIKNYTVKHTIEEKYIFPDTDLSTLVLDGNYIIGHSHYQFDRSFKGCRLINTGSLGQNRKVINMAEYIIFDEKNNQIELKHFKYDIEIVIQKMKEEKYPEICIEYYESKKKI
ncbi:metallophosphoesterase family protein [Salegentibacter sp. HM20]